MDVFRYFDFGISWEVIWLILPAFVELFTSFAVVDKLNSKHLVSQSWG